MAATESENRQRLDSLPNPAGLFWAKALFWDEKRPPPVLVVPKRLLEVPVDVPNPKPVLVEEVAGWLNVVEPNNPPEEEETINHLPSPTAEGVLQVWFVAAADGWLWVSPFSSLHLFFPHILLYSSTVFQP